MQVTVGISKDHAMTGAAMFEPSTSFIERHGLLVARSISHAHTGRMLVQLLNPSQVSGTINKNERIGSLYPMDGKVCSTKGVSTLKVQQKI